MAAKMGARGVKIMEFDFDVMIGVNSYVILIAESEFERQNLQDRVKTAIRM